MDLESAANAQICDPTTLLHWNHIRQADSKSWHALANARQRMVLQRLCGRWLKARGYAPDPRGTVNGEVTVRERLDVEVDLMVGPRDIRGSRRLAAVSGDGSGAQAYARAPDRRPGGRHRLGGRDAVATQGQPNRRAPHRVHDEAEPA